jgi:hypothetical protein
MRLLLPTIVHGQAFRKITSMFYTVPSSWGLDSYQTPDSVRISSDTTFSAEIQEYGSELKRQGSLGSWANTVAFSKMFAYPDHQTYWRRKARTDLINWAVNPNTGILVVI